MQSSHIVTEVKTLSNQGYESQNSSDNILIVLFKEALFDLFDKGLAGKFEKHGAKLRLVGIAKTEIFIRGTPHPSL